MATEVVSIIDPDSGSGYDYDSLYDWEAAEQGDLTGARDEIAVAKCRCTGGTADTTIVEINGWTASATQYIKIWTDPEESYRHTGVYPASGNTYRMYLNGGAGVGINIVEPYSQLIGIAFHLHTYANVTVRVGGSGAGWATVAKCVVKGAGIASSSGIVITYEGSGSGSGSKICNNIVYDFANGIYRGAADQVCAIYNNTVHNCTSGFNAQNSSNFLLKNNIAQDCTTCYTGTFSSSSTNNCSDDNTQPGSNGRNGEVTFSDEANDDFSLDAEDSIALGYGLNLYNDATYAFQDDIIGTTRGGSGAVWDIGAFHSLEKVSIVDPNSGTGYDYDSLYDWEAAEQVDLTNENRIKIATCRCTGGTADTTAVEIDGWTTSATQYIKIWTDPAESYQHSGKWETGNKYRLNTSGAYVYALTVKEAYCRIFGIQFYNSHADSHGALLLDPLATNAASYFVIKDCIFRGGRRTGTSSRGVDQIDALAVYINCISYGASYGYGFGYDYSVNGPPTQHFYNCISCKNGGSGFYVRSGGTVKNCYAGSNGSDDINGGTKTTCASEDTTGTAGLTEIAFSTSEGAYFTNISDGTEDFSISSLSDLLGVGTNLYNDANYPFQDDIIGTDRGGSGAAWDIGAFHSLEKVSIVDPDSGTGYDYDSLYDWEAAEQVDLTNENRIKIATCRCTGGTADTTAVTIDGWTTSATQYIKIWTDTAEAYRHSGTYPSGNKYRLELASGNNDAIFIINEGYTRVLGIPVYNTRTTTGDVHVRCIEVNSGLTGACQIGYCIVRKIVNGANYAMGIRTSSVVHIFNCLIYDFIHSSYTHIGIDRVSGASSLAYNCTAHNCGIGFHTEDSGDNSTTQFCVKNCLAASCTDGFNADWAFASASNYNASSNASDALGANSRNSQTFTFADEANDNFALAVGDGGALGYGVNLYNDAAYAFQTDIIGTDRGGSGASWDIGAFEYNASIARSLIAALQASSTTSSINASIARSLIAVLEASSTTSSINALIARSLTAALEAPSTTSSINASIVRSLIAELEASSTTPGIAVTLTGVIALIASIQAQSSTQSISANTLRTVIADIQALSSTAEIQSSILRNILSVIQASSTTPDLESTIARAISAAINASSATPGIQALTSRFLTSNIQASSLTPDIAISISGIISLIASIAAMSTTPGIAVNILRNIIADINSVSSTQNPTVSILRNLLVSISAESDTAGVQFQIARYLSAIVIGQSTTPDITATIQGLIALIASISGVSATPSVSAALNRSLNASIGADSITPDAIGGIIRPLIAAIQGLSQTPDIEAVITSIVSLAASISGVSITSNISSSITRLISAAINGQSETSEIIAITARELIANIQAASISPDDLILYLDSLGVIMKPGLSILDRIIENSIVQRTRTTEIVNRISSVEIV